MIKDTNTELLDAVALNTGAAGTYLLGSQYDTGATPTLKDMGLSQDFWLVAKVTTAATSGGSATLQLKVVSDDTTSISTTTSTVHYTSAAIPVASLTAGALIFATKLPIGDYERYIGILQVTGTAAFTAGNIEVFVTPDFPKYVAYPDPLVG